MKNQAGLLQEKSITQNTMITYSQSETVLNSRTKLINYHYDLIPSTQLLAREQVNNLIPVPDQWYLYTSNGQSGGIGQHDRKWESPYGLNVYATYCFFLKQEVSTIVLYIPPIVGLSVTQVLESYDIKCSLKWTNDILINQKKVSGILSECTNEDRGGFVSVLTGIGINVNSEYKHLSNILQPATSMKIETGRNYDLKEVIYKLSNIFETNINSLIINNFKIFKVPIEQHLEKFDNLPIIFDTTSDSPDRYIVGFIKGIGNEGELLLTIKNTEKEKSFFNGRILRGKEIEQALSNTSVLEKLISKIHFDTIDSTQVYAKNHLNLIQNDWKVVVADYQNEGIGLSGDGISPRKQSILATFLLPHPNKLNDLQLDQIAALSVLNTLKECGVTQEIKIKWQNDVQVQGKKVSGILTEILDYNNHKICLIGIGININQDEESLKEVNQPITSLKIAVNSESNLSVEEIFLLLEKNLYLNITTASQYGYEYSKADIESNLAFLNTVVKVFDEDTKTNLIGKLIGLGDVGSLLIDSDSIHEVINGKISIDYNDSIYM
ncbi:biotin--[acetyl-CoA-carboxylase] ligase [Candidatus Tisiphia endosymbiont of Piscicola geometra]|uniref:biotin--[acetyl-CoA-carboxylase] ligase n=1 Tax=Candidatus Tisiphia endosymbiont of Piscicola geometra TaxID=3066273 RepID=UPI00312CA116